MNREKNVLPALCRERAPQSPSRGVVPMNRLIAIALLAPVLMLIITGQAAGFEPWLLHGTFAGGGGYDKGHGMAMDGEGNIFLSTTCQSPEFPIDSLGYDTELGGPSDIMILKFSPQLELLAATFVGGDALETSRVVRLDANGAVTVAGWTESTDFPATAGAFDTTHNGDKDICLFKLTPDLQTLQAATYLGGAEPDFCYNLVLAPNGDVALAGSTKSDDFPATAGAFDTSFGGEYDVVAARFSPDLDQLLAATFCGGAERDEAYAVAVRDSGAIVVAGGAESLDFPSTTGSFDPVNNGGGDIFVLDFTPDLAALNAGTFYGGSQVDVARGLVLDNQGQACLTGYSTSPDLPMTAGAFDPLHNGAEDCCVAILSSSLDQLVAATYLGGAEHDRGYDLTLDHAGLPLVTGYTGSTGFPTSPSAFDPTHNGLLDVFLVRLSPELTDLHLGTFFGGAAGETGRRVLSQNGVATLMGTTGSSGFPTTPDTFDPVHNGQGDIYALRVKTGTSVAGLSCTPCSGTLPFSFQICCTMINQADIKRKQSARIDLELAGGGTITNYRSGYQVMESSELFEICWQQQMLAIGTLLGETRFTLLVEDTTSAPYNQPPRLPSGDQDSASRLILGNAPAR